jgi:ribosomal protein S18 acetylase RimI-like enzyme
MWNVRPARQDEREQIAALWTEAGLGVMSDSEWEAISAGPCAKVIVAEQDGVVGGAAVTAFDGWRAYLYHVAVSREHRGEGLAHKLMADGEAILRARGAARIYLMVSEFNIGGLALSATMGYEPESDIVFVKEFAPAPALARA